VEKTLLAFGEIRRAGSRFSRDRVTWRGIRT
jgi:hypothetical protein